MQYLSSDTILQGGRYRIVKMLGEGGFGITYLGIQIGLERQIVIKEFFMKDYCERDEFSNLLYVPTSGNRDFVARFKEKFLKEARHIAKLNHPNIVSIIDVFEENGTAYYAMEFAVGGSLADKVEREGCLSEEVATRYILQVANALKYIHQRNMNHLDVKPGNIMLNENDNVILIDFGLSKQYDVSTGHQTSTTPVGISHGYAPIEQYKEGGVAEFSPETDIYSLGATFYYLLTGVRPPGSLEISEDGLPIDLLQAKNVSRKTISAICNAMKTRKKDRTHDISIFIQELTENISQVNSIASEENIQTQPNGDQQNETVIIKARPENEYKGDVDKKEDASSIKILLIVMTFIVVFIISFSLFKGQNEATTVYDDTSDTVVVVDTSYYLDTDTQSLDYYGEPADTPVANTDTVAA